MSTDNSVRTYREGPRVSTVLWGLIVILVGAALIAWGSGVRFDLGISAAVVLGIGGVALLGAAFVPAIRGRKDEPDLAQPAQTQPIQDEHTQAQPVQTQPAHGEHTQAQPVQTQPIQDEPIQDKPN